MDGLFVIIGLLVLLYLLLMPAFAWFKASSAEKEIEDLRALVNELRAQLRTERLPKKTVDAMAPKPANKAEPEPVVVLPPLSEKPLVTIPPPLPIKAASPAPFSRVPEISLEQFLGVKLFAWIGGLALFLGIVFFVKYAFDRNLISPAVRIGIGYIIGGGLIAAGVLMRRRAAYAVLVQTLIATGVLILYGVTYAAHALYHFSAFGTISTFVCMSLITIGAFALSVWMTAPVIAVLGMVGGFLTPVLVNTGVDNPFGLFSYILLLDLGLIAVAKRREWFYLVACAAAGTLLMQMGWFSEWFWKGGYKDGQGIWIMAGVFLLFPLVFTLASAGRRVAASASWPWVISPLVLMAWSYLAAHYFMEQSALRATPHLVMTMALVLVVCLLLLQEMRKLAWAGFAAGAGMAALALHWVNVGPVTAQPWGILGWSLAGMTGLGFYAFGRRSSWQPILIWAASAMAWLFFYPVVHQVIEKVWPNEMMGLLPLSFAVATTIGFMAVWRRSENDLSLRNAQLAWFGGVALCFITLIFPVQFERQWITLGWAFEGAALCWLFTKVPHEGLQRLGFGLLTSSFFRLAVNPAVLSYHERSEWPVWNWFLYTYGLVALAMFAAAWWLAPPRDRLDEWPVRALLWSYGGVLLFLLLNIEIADYFTPVGCRFIAIHWGGDFARSMTFSIAWALYALVLLIIGFRLDAKGARYAGIGLMVVTLLKLFFHDLANLGSIYRIGALIAVAVIALGASFLYQRFYSQRDKKCDDGQAD